LEAFIVNLEKLNDLPSWEWPEDAAATILDTLKNGSASEKDRLLAAELAGDLVILNEEIADRLLNVIYSKDESDELRSKAAISLGAGLEEAEYADYDDPDDDPAFSKSFLKKIQQSLHKLYSDPGAPMEVRRHVLESSVRNPQSWHADAIRTAYAAKEAKWKLTAVFCMGFVKGFDAQILDALKSTDPEIHYHAVEAAGNWELDAAWPHIVKLVTSEETDKPLRIAAIMAAASIRPHESEIIEPLADSYDEDIAEAAMDALSEAGLAEYWDSEDDSDDDLDYDFEDEEDEDDEEDDEDHKI
jgi:hypothetical protein